MDVHCIHCIHYTHCIHCTAYTAYTTYTAHTAVALQLRVLGHTHTRPNLTHAHAHMGLFSLHKTHSTPHTSYEVGMQWLEAYECTGTACVRVYRYCMHKSVQVLHAYECSVSFNVEEL